MRRSATKRRRSGTVSSIALSASRKPTITLIAANSEVDWSLGWTAFASSRSSSSAGSTFRRPAASVPQLARDASILAAARLDEDLRDASLAAR